VDSAHAYVAARAIGRPVAERFGVGFYGGPGLMSGRVVFPIHDEWGRLVAYAGRALDGSAPRYRFPAGFYKSQVLFNYHRAAAAAGNTVVVVEGFFDCLRVTQAGFPNVVALLGTALYERPAELLRGRFDGVVLMLDGDAAGRPAQEGIARRLRQWRQVRVVGLPDGVQPDSLPEWRLRELLGSATVGRVWRE